MEKDIPKRIESMSLNQTQSTQIKFPPIAPPSNGILKLYNQFPRRYTGGLLEMIADLPRIAKIGFNAVWLNPIQIPGEAYKKDGISKGSLYAMADDELFNDQFFPGINDHQQRVKLVQEYTCTARTLGLIPLFDLVLNHVAKDSPLSEKFQKYLKTAENKPIKGFSKAKSKEKEWEDVIPFNYETEENREYIINNLWKSFIDKYIQQYGFAGVRVDAITSINTELQNAVFNLLKEKTDPVILGELMTGNPEKK